MSRIGSMRHKIDLQTKVSTPQVDANAGTTDTFTSLTDDEGLDADVRVLNPVDKAGGLNRGDAATHVFTTRFMASYTAGVVDSRLYVDFDSRKFKVVGIRNVKERSRFMEIRCEEIGTAQVGATP